MKRCETARCAYIHDWISDTLDSGKNFWKESRNLGVISKASDALHGFMPDELNDHFSRIGISPTEDPAASLDILATAPLEGFRFSQVIGADVILAVSHFKSQARGKGGILHSIVAKAQHSVLGALGQPRNQKGK